MGKHEYLVAYRHYNHRNDLGYRRVDRTRLPREMLCASICRRKTLLLVVLGVLHVFAWTGIIFTIRNARSDPHRISMSKSIYLDLFETYTNYTGPRPIPRPIDLPSSFRFAINEPGVCGSDRHPGLRVLHYVLSAPQRIRKRKFIRRTWASPKFFSQFKMATVFFLGRTNNATLQALIERESAQFKDIIQADFPDEYYRLTYKAVFALAWISRFCSRAEHVVKTDDDVLVNAFRLTDILAGNETDDDAIHCSVYSSYAPHRNPRSKWFVRPREYPWKKYPDFCAGMAVYHAGHLVPKLYAATTEVPYLKFEDVYVTGMLRRHAGIGIKNIGTEVNLFTRNNCLQKAPKPEAFCLVDSVATGEDLWLQLMLMEVRQRSRKSEKNRLKYLDIFADILNKGFQ